MPCAPLRYSKLHNITSNVWWYDLGVSGSKYKFEEKYNTKELYESMELIEKVIIQELNILNGNSRNLFLSGYS